MNVETTVARIVPHARDMVAEWPPGEGALLILEVEGMPDASMVIPMPRAELLNFLLEGMVECGADAYPENMHTIEMLRHPPRGAVPWVASTHEGRIAVGLIVPKATMTKGGDA